MESKTNKFKDNSIVFKAFCDETRLCILDILKSGEKCACILLQDLNISQSTLSHHMKILVESEIVLARKEGKWIHYSISEKGIKNAQRILNEILPNN